MEQDIENPFDGLNEENALRMCVYLVYIAQKMTLSEVYDKYGYIILPGDLGKAIALVPDIAQRGVIIGQPKPITPAKQSSKTGTGCFLPIVAIFGSFGLFVSCLIALISMRF